jgi:5-formyltetrahydrofolate cyclo-ligase
MNIDKNSIKIKIRKESKKQLKQLTDKEKALKDTLINDRIFCIIQEYKPKFIGLYFPIKNEVSILRLTEKLLDENYSIFYPRFKREALTSSGYEMSSFSDFSQLKPGLFNIPEPSQNAYTVQNSAIDLWLIPGLAFSPEGVRLGRGGGYYDRLVADSCGIKIGVLYECQLMSDVPWETHDIFMDMLIMENKTLNICKIL